MPDADASARSSDTSGDHARDAQFVRSLFADAAPRYDTVVRASTLGMDRLWKRRLGAAPPGNREYRRILDLACGTGIVTRKLARTYPDATVVGLDVSPDMLAVARDRTATDRIRFVEKPAEELDDLGADTFDLVTGSYLPKYTDLPRLAANTATVLRDGGVAVFHDFTYPRTWPYPPVFDLYWAGLARFVERVPGYDRIADDLRGLILDARGWPARLQRALDREGFDRTRVDVQPLEIAAIVTAVDDGLR